jgi:hypothetical protein
LINIFTKEREKVSKTNSMQDGDTVGVGMESIYGGGQQNIATSNTEGTLLI